MMHRPVEAAIRPGFRPVFVAIIVFFAAAIASGILIWRLEQQRMQEERVRVSSLAGDHAYDLQRRLDRVISATYSLAALVRQGHGVITDFDGVANYLLPFYPGAAALQLAPGGVISQVVPLAGNEAAIGHDLLKDPDRDKEAKLARNTGKLTLAGPFNLKQGGVGAVARLPIFLEDDQGNPIFWGFTIVLLRFPDVLDKSLLSQLPMRGFGYELWRIHPDTGKKQIIAATASVPLVEAVEHPIQVPNGTWTLSMAPAAGWGDPSGLSFKILLGLLFSLLLAWLAKLLDELKLHETGLEEQVRARTAELVASGVRLRESEFLFHSQFDLGNIGIAITSPEKGWLRANARLCRMLGYSEEELLQRTWEDMTHPDDLQSSIERFQSLLSGEIDGYELDKRFICKNGEIIHTHLTVACYRNDGQVQFLISSIQDITDRVRSDADLRLAQFCIEHAAIGVFRVDEGGRIASANNHACRSLGYSREELCALTIFDIDPTFSRERWLAHRQGIRAKGSGTVESLHRRKDGTVFPVEVVISYMEYDGKPFSFSFVLDVSDRKRVEEEIRTINAELEQRIEERTRNLAETAHELEMANESLQEEIAERRKAEETLRYSSAALAEKNAELERLNRLFVGRELRMRELKERIAALEKATTVEGRHEA